MYLQADPDKIANELCKRMPHPQHLAELQHRAAAMPDSVHAKTYASQRDAAIQVWQAVSMQHTDLMQTVLEHHAAVVHHHAWPLNTLAGACLWPELNDAHCAALTRALVAVTMRKHGGALCLDLASEDSLPGRSMGEHLVAMAPDARELRLSH